MIQDPARAAAIKATIESRVGYLHEHPERARVLDKAAIAVLDSGLRCRLSTAEGPVTASDMPTQVGGDASAPTPGWFMRAALAACDATTIAMRAARLGEHSQACLSVSPAPAPRATPDPTPHPTPRSSPRGGPGTLLLLGRHLRVLHHRSL
jgi:hypothetical protein